MPGFDAETIRLLAREREVDVVVARPDDSRLQVTIWVVVDGSDVFVRSWRGHRGYWYQAALDRPDDVELVVAGRRVPVRVVLATDTESITRCSAGFEAKYAGDPSTPGMLRDDVVGTTLRVEPR